MSRRPIGKGTEGLEQRARSVAADLRRLVEDVASAHPQFLDVGRLPEQLEIPLRFSHGRSDADQGETLLQTIRHALSEFAFSGAIALGHLFCFQCQSASCGHSRPPDAQSVFGGYLATGKPGYLPFSRACLELAPQESERLFDDVGGVVSLIWDGPRLRAELLESFGKESRAFRVIGQLSVGYLTIAEERRVLSLLPVVVQRPGGAMRVLLNVLGLDERELLGENLNFDSENLQQALRRTRARLAGLRKRQRALARSDGEPPTLDQLAESELVQTRGVIERLFKRRRRSTQHARDRRQEQRPTAAAMADLSSCRDDELFLDTRHDTVVALGSKGRVHVFNRSGHHVTSFKLEREAVQRRLERKRWCALTTEEIARFRAAFAP